MLEKYLKKYFLYFCFRMTRKCGKFSFFTSEIVNLKLFTGIKVYCQLQFYFIFTVSEANQESELRLSFVTD